MIIYFLPAPNYYTKGSNLQMFKKLNQHFHWIRIARKEFLMQFSFKKSSGGRDFVWLSLLLALLLVFALLIIGSKEGLSERLVDLLLGRVPGHGIPVWVRSNPFTEGGQNLIDDHVMKLVEYGDTRLKIHPYREVDQVMLELPGENIWNITGYDPDSPQFEGIAVYNNDPLWEFAWNEKAYSNELSIVLNLSIFEKYFNFDTYCQTLKKLLPSCLYKEIPSKKNFFSKKTNNTIWLLVGSNDDLLRVNFIWMDRIPIPGNFAYLFPLKIYHILEKKHHYSKLRYFPEAINLIQNSGGKRAKKIFINRKVDKNKRQEFARCIGDELTESRSHFFLEPHKSLPVFWVEACAKQARIPHQPKNLYRIAVPEIGDVITHDDKGRISLPCKKIPEHDLSDDELKNCRENYNFQVYRKVMAYSRSFVYVPDRIYLSETVSSLKKLEGRPLLIPWIYSDALRRFGALINIFDLLSKPYAILFCVFLTCLLGVQIAGLVGHRRHNYGIFLAKGISRSHIYYILYFQTYMALIIGMSAAIGILTVIRINLNYKLLMAVEKFKDVLTIQTPNLLPLTNVDYILVFLVCLGAAWILTTVILILLPVKYNTMPGDLLQE